MKYIPLSSGGTAKVHTGGPDCCADCKALHDRYGAELDARAAAKDRGAA